MGGSANLDRPGRNPHPAAMAEIRAELSIVGGGLNGLTLGIACAGAGIETAIIDRENPSRMTAPGFDGRTSAIAFGSKRVLEAVGVWPRLAGRAEAIREIRVADAGAPLFLHYDHREIGADPFGWIVENRDLRAALYARAAELPALRLIAPASVAEARREPAGTTLALADGGTVRSQLIAAADGKDSALRQAAGIRVAAWAYPQLAIVATIRHERPHHGVAVEHFLPAGPFAILPMTGNRSSIVWTERAALAPKLAALPDDAFRAELGARFGDFLGALEFEGPRWTYPLAFLHAERMVAPRLALIGEAAHLIHPIAGQGAGRMPGRRQAARARSRRRRDPAALSALAPVRRDPAGVGDGWTQSPVLEFAAAPEARARSRPRRGRPGAAGEALLHAPRHGHGRRFAAVGARRSALD
jgi:2-octaprenyl-6-methoxyphenol hydroxylase